MEHDPAARAIERELTALLRMALSLRADFAQGQITQDEAGAMNLALGRERAYLYQALHLLRQNATSGPLVPATSRGIPGHVFPRASDRAKALRRARALALGDPSPVGRARAMIGGEEQKCADTGRDQSESAEGADQAR